MPTSFGHRIPLSRASAIVCLAALLLTLLLSTLIANVLDRGLDMSDEGVYLISILNPATLLSMPSDFGTLLHPVYKALGGDVHKLRLLGFAGLMGTSLLLSLSWLLLWRRHSPLPPLSTAALGMTLAGAGLAYYVNWTPTPSYNWLALIGTMGVFATLALYTLSQRPRHAHAPALRFFSLTLLAVFGLLAFIGKGTTGAGLGLLTLVCLLCCGGPRLLRARLCDALYAGVVALSLLGVYLFSQSQGLTVFKKILLCAELMDSTYGASQTLAFYAQYFLPLSYLPIFALYALWLAVGVALHKERLRPAACIAGVATLYMLVLACILPTTDIMALCLWPLFSAVLVGSALWRRSWQHWRKALLTALALFAGVFIYHAGTNTEVEFKMTEALALPCAAVMVMALSMRVEKRGKVLPALALILCCMVWGALSTSFLKPFRHNGRALWQQDQPLQLTPGTTPLRVHAERLAFVHWLRETTAAHGWAPGTPLLNSTYYTSTALYLLNASMVAASWQLEARHTPLENFPRIYAHVPPEVLRSAWILKPVQAARATCQPPCCQNWACPFLKGMNASASPRRKRAKASGLLGIMNCGSRDYPERVALYARAHC